MNDFRMKISRFTVYESHANDVSKYLRSYIIIIIMFILLFLLHHQRGTGSYLKVMGKSNNYSRIYLYLNTYHSKLHKMSGKCPPLPSGYRTFVAIANNYGHYQINVC